jgi:glycosyltransferase involved in cell wall biosynthesis
MKVCSGGIGLKCKYHRCESFLMFIPKLIIYRLINIYVKNVFSAFICHSNFMLDLLRREGFEEVYYVPLNMHDFMPVQHLAHSSMKNNTTNLLFVGVLSWHKGVMELVQAMSILSKGAYSYHLTIIGSGEKRNEIDEFIRLYDLKPFIQLIGNVSREVLRDYYSKSDIIVFPSYFESFGLVAFEAMAFGKYLVTTRRGALTEIVSEYPKSKTILSIEPEEIANAIDECRKEIEQNVSGACSTVGPSYLKLTMDATMKALSSLLNNVIRSE